MYRLLISLMYIALAAPANCQYQLPPGDGRDSVQRVGSECHGLDYLNRRDRTRAAWQDTVDTMMTRGAIASPEELTSIVTYLVENFGSVESEKMRPAKVNVNLASANRLIVSLNLFPEEAEAIIAYREKNGNFKEWQDLKKVPGVDTGKVEMQKDRLVF
jgi:competence protein ComEA